MEKGMENSKFFNASRRVRKRTLRPTASLPLRCAMITAERLAQEQPPEPRHPMSKLIEKAGHQIVDGRVLPVEREALLLHVESLLESDADTIIITSEIASPAEDVVGETVRVVLNNNFLDLSEPFRFLCYQTHPGHEALLSQALCGSAHGKLILWLCGPHDAIQIALLRVLLPKIRELTWELCRRTPLGGLRAVPVQSKS